MKKAKELKNPRPAPKQLAAARAADARLKFDRVMRTVPRLLESGYRITFAGVAREARVSTWFLYNTVELKTAVRNAIDEQAAQEADTGRPAGDSATADSVATDLALARQEIRELRIERDKLKKRLQLSLGAELDEVNRSDLIQRVEDVERENTALREEAIALASRADLSSRRVGQLEADLSAARLSLRRMVKQVAKEPHTG